MQNRTTAYIFWSVAIACMMGFVLPQLETVSAVSKVEICHIPPENPDNFHIINVSENVLRAHLRHGDFRVGEACSEGVGECRVEGSTQCDVADTCSAVPDSPPEDPETSCGDGRDNDCDGLIDTQDDDCAPLPCEVTLGGFCWFTGSTNESCANVCASVNRSYDEATRTFAGSDGTDENCAALGTAFSSAVFAGTWDRGGIGCGYSVGNFVRRDTDPTTPGATHPLHPGRFCACE
jgi:hypothetical protein